MRTYGVVVFVLLVVAPAGARANALVSWTGLTGYGGLVPLADVKIGLRSETLKIKVGDVPAYTVHASYVLDNPGPKQKLLYGVPVVHGSRSKPEEQAERIQIRVGGRRYRCSIPKEEELKQQGPEAKKLLEKLLGSDFPMETAPTWCVVQLAIPKGKVKLELRYSGEMLYADTAADRCAWGRARRDLVHPLWPAGYPDGKAQRVEATVDLGPLADYVTATEPEGSEREGSVLRWRWEQVDLKLLKTIRATYVLDPVAHGKEMKGFNRAALAVRSSSPGAHKLIDGKRHTAWCAAGENAWVEQRLTEHPRSYVYGYETVGAATMNSDEKKPGRFLHDFPSARWTDLEPAFVVAHGLGTDPMTFAANNRVRQLRISPCTDAPKVFSDYTLPRVKDPDQAVQQLRLSGELLKAYRSELDRWSARLRSEALPCLELCRARGIKRCGPWSKRPPGPKAGDNLCGQLHCEVKCMRAAAVRLKGKADTELPCLRFTILELDQAKGPEAETCLRELAPCFNRCW